MGSARASRCASGSHTLINHLPWLEWTAMVVGCLKSRLKELGEHSAREAFSARGALDSSATHTKQWKAFANRGVMGDGAISDMIRAHTTRPRLHCRTDGVVTSNIRSCVLPRQAT